MTDCRASDQMGTRDCEMSEVQQIYTLPAPLRSATHTTAQNKRRGRDVEKYGQGVKGQTVRED